MTVTIGISTMQSKSKVKWNSSCPNLYVSLTGFYPKLKSFVSCRHMNCCQHYMLRINIHILYILFIKLNLNLKEFQESNTYIKSYQEDKIEFLDELYFNLNLKSNLNIVD